MDERPAQPMEERLAEIFRAIAGREDKYTPEEITRKVGIDLEFGLAMWRAFGMARPDPEARSFDDRDVESMEAIKALLDLGHPPQDIIAVARVFGRALSRIAEAEQRVYNRQFVEPMLREGLDVEQIGERLTPISQMVLPLVEQLILNAHARALDHSRRQLVLTGSGSATEPYAVCLVDLVDYSSLSATLDAGELSGLLERFEGVASDACVEFGTRLVKTIGDAAMFVAREPGAVADTALRIVEQVEADPGLPGARGGIDYGDVLPLEGDYYGHPVNVAARICAAASPGTVAASRAVADGLNENGLLVEELGPRALKGVGEIDLVGLSRG